MITDADRVLAARFAATRDRIDDADWSDVLGRRSPSAKRPRRRALWVVSVALAAVVLPVALAFAAELHDAFFGKPAPPIVKRAFVGQNRMTQLMRRWQKTHGGSAAVPPMADAAKAHGVLAVKTADGLLLLWAAPAGRGRECWIVDFAADQISHKRPIGGGSCDLLKPAHTMYFAWNWSALHPALKVLNGRLYVDAVAVKIDFPNRPPATVPVVDRYYLAAYPRSTKLPTKITAINAHGKPVATLVLTKHG